MSAKNLVHSICALLERGYVPYHGPMAEETYRELGCERRKRAQWFCDAEQRYICVGCQKRHCTLLSPSGVWPVLLSGGAPKPGRLAFAELPALSVEELLRVKSSLRPDEVAWALNCSQSRVYELLDENQLEELPYSPRRVSSASVKRLLMQALPENGTMDSVSGKRNPEETGCKVK